QHQKTCPMRSGACKPDCRGHPHIVGRYTSPVKTKRATTDTQFHLGVGSPLNHLPQLTDMTHANPTCAKQNESNIGRNRKIYACSNAKPTICSPSRHVITVCSYMSRS